MVAGFFIWNMDKDEFSAKLRNSVYKIIFHTQIFWCCGIILTYGEITLLRLGGVGGVKMVEASVLTHRSLHIFV